MNNEFNNMPEEEQTAMQNTVTGPDTKPEQQQSPAEPADAAPQTRNPSAADTENIYAQKTDNQNEAFAQSQSFHRETPYRTETDNGTQQQAQQPCQNTVNRMNFDPYTGQPIGQNADPSGKTSGKTSGNPSLQTAAPVTKKKWSFLKKAASALALALIFGVTAGGVILGMTGGAKDDGAGSDQAVSSGITEQEELPPQLNGSVSGQLQSASTAMQEALQKAEIAMQDNLTIPQINIIMEPAMVSINCIGETTVNSFFGAQTYQTASSGSGIIVGENETELLIVTNNHVIADTTEISVQFVDETECTALVKGTDVLNDLAIIVVNLAEIPEETMRSIAYAEIGDSDALVIGEGVVAIGNALGFGQSVTQGIVSALNRAVTDSNGNTTYLIQTDAAINPGNSGGALVNMKGQVIGINSAKYSDEAVEGMCFAIPVNTAMPILEELMSRTTRVEVTDPEKAAYLGINYEDVTSAMAAAYRMPVGVYVTAVGEGTPAEQAGILPGDIITKFDHDTITGYSDLRTALSYYAAGETVDMVVQRAERGQYVETVITITLGARPAEDAAQTPDNAPSNGGNSGYGDDDADDYPSWFDFFGW